MIGFGVATPKPQHPHAPVYFLPYGSLRLSKLEEGYHDRSPPIHFEPPSSPIEMHSPNLFPWWEQIPNDEEGGLKPVYGSKAKHSHPNNFDVRPVPDSVSWERLNLALGQEERMVLLGQYLFELFHYGLEGGITRTLDEIAATIPRPEQEPLPEVRPTTFWKDMEEHLRIIHENLGLLDDAVEQVYDRQQRFILIALENTFSRLSWTKKLRLISNVARFGFALKALDAFLETLGPCPYQQELVNVRNRVNTCYLTKGVFDPLYAMMKDLLREDAPLMEQVAQNHGDVPADCEDKWREIERGFAEFICGLLPDEPCSLEAYRPFSRWGIIFRDEVESTFYFPLYIECLLVVMAKHRPHFGERELDLVLGLLDVHESIYSTPDVFAHPLEVEPYGNEFSWHTRFQDYSRVLWVGIGDRVRITLDVLAWIRKRIQGKDFGTLEAIFDKRMETLRLRYEESLQFYERTLVGRVGSLEKLRLRALFAVDENVSDETGRDLMEQIMIHGAIYPDEERKNILGGILLAMAFFQGKGALHYIIQAYVFLNGHEKEWAYLHRKLNHYFWEWLSYFEEREGANPARDLTQFLNIEARGFTVAQSGLYLRALYSFFARYFDDEISRRTLLPRIRTLMQQHSIPVPRVRRS
ncbi:MAG TPA: hypothetical protein DDW49_03265 [Deltaproteobacteria bacterium]|nr:MAG: hypothetical protein A2048_00385 [Deltaproteobacteria bacterium GWA2_45_12]HBF12401.1 hypothetical protein [Deltaproteobacteria bacterium]